MSASLPLLTLVPILLKLEGGHYKSYHPKKGEAGAGTRLSGHLK